MKKKNLDGTRPNLGKASNEQPTNIQMISLDKIDPPVFSREYLDEDYSRLKNSMSKMKQLQNIVVKKIEGNRYRCVSGWTRVLVAKDLGWKEILAKISDIPDNEEILYSLAENLCRKDLSPMEREKGLYELHKQSNKSFREIARIIGISREWVRKNAETYPIRQDLKDDKVASDLPTDIVYEMKNLDKNAKILLSKKIEEGELNADVSEVRGFIKNLQEADNSHKEKILGESNTTPKITESIENPGKYQKILDKLKEIDFSEIEKLDDKSKKQVEQLLHYSIALLAYDLYKLKILDLADCKSILSAVKIPETSFQHWEE